MRAATCTAALKYDKVRFAAFGYSHDAETGATDTDCASARYLVYAMLRRIDGAGKAVAATTFADDLDAPGRHLVAEGCGRFEIDWIPCQLHERVAGFVRVRTGDVRAPVAPWVGGRAPHACFYCRHAGWVDVEAVDSQ